MTQAQETLIESLANDPDVKKLVLEIEKKPATTQHHYGDYGAALSRLSNGNKSTALFLSLAFIKAGAHSQGVQSAFKAFF